MCKDCEWAYRLLTARFGRDHGTYLLWNKTAYPFSSGDVTLAQARHAIARAEVLA